MVGPGDEDEQGVDEPDAVGLDELRDGLVPSDGFLHHVVEQAEGAYRAPKAAGQEKRDREERPPQDPGVEAAQVIVGVAGAEQELPGDDHEDPDGDGLRNGWEPFALEDGADDFIFHQIGAH